MASENTLFHIYDVDMATHEYEHLVDILAPTQKAAYTAAYAQFDMEDGHKIRVYRTLSDGDNINAAALEIARRTAKNAVQRDGTSRQWTIRNAMYSPAWAENADCADMFGQAVIGLLECLYSGADIPTCYRAAYASVNSYLRAARAIHADNKPLHISIEAWVDAIADGDADSNPDIVDVQQDLNRILKLEDAAVTTAHEAVLNELYALLARLTPRQISALRYRAKGYSFRATAEKMGLKSQKTVYEHMVTIRSYANDYPALISYVTRRGMMK